MGKIREYFPNGNKSEVHKRSLVEAVLYLVDNGCKWRELPHDYPNWSTVKSFYYRAIASRIWEKVMNMLVRETRMKASRKENPSYNVDRLAKCENNQCGSIDREKKSRQPPLQVVV